MLGDGHRDALDVGFLEAVLAQALRGHVAGEGHHRHRVHIGGGDAGDEVRCARAAGGQHHAGAARCTGVAVRRVGCALLVGGQHMGDAVGVFVQLVVEVQHCAAGVAEEGVHPLLTEHLHKDLRTVQLHGEFLLFPFPFSTLHTFFPNTLRDSTRHLINKRSLSLIQETKTWNQSKTLCGTTLVDAFRALSRASNKAPRSNGRHRRCLADVPYIVLQQAAPGGFRAGPPAALHRPAAL